MANCNQVLIIRYLNQGAIGLFLIYGAAQKKGRARSVLKAKAGLGNEGPLSHSGNKQESMYKSKDFFLIV